MQNSEAVEILEYFEDKAAKLESLTLAAHLSSSAPKGIIEFRDEAIFLPDSAPEDEAIDAFVLTLRLFIQDREPISFSRLALLYDTLPVDANHKARFTASRTALNKHLDSRPPLVMSGHSNREILYTFLYGGLAHGHDKQLRVQFNAWREDAVTFAFRKASFAMILTELLHFIHWLRGFNRETLQMVRGNDV